MSARAVRWAVAASAPSPAAVKLVLLIVAHHFEDRYRAAWCPISMLTEQAGLCERQVHRHIGTLRRAGLVTTEQWRNDDGTWMPTTYRLPAVEQQKDTA